MSIVRLRSRRSFLYSAACAAGVPFVAQLPRSVDVSSWPDFPPLQQIKVGGMDILPSAPPKGLLNRPDLGILLNQSMSAQRIFAPRPPLDWCGESRAVRTSRGDYLVMLTTGKHHYAGQMTKTNDIVAFRSSDGGKTWAGPKITWDIPYNQHGFVPLIPWGSKRIYAFGTEP